MSEPNDRDREIADLTDGFIDHDTAVIAAYRKELQAAHEREVEGLRALVKDMETVVRTYAYSHPRWKPTNYPEQDPLGAHALVDRLDVLAASGSGEAKEETPLQSKLVEVYNKHIDGCSCPRCAKPAAPEPKMEEPPRVCGNCSHGQRTSLDDTRCYKATPYLPTGRWCEACPDWKACGIIANPRALAQRKEGE